MKSSDDPHDLNRFVQAQQADYERQLRVSWHDPLTTKLSVPPPHESTAERQESSAVPSREVRLTPIEIEGASPASTSRAPRGAQSTAVDQILSIASSLKATEELEELTAGLLALRAARLAPVVSDPETSLLISINEGVSVKLTDRVASLVQKRDDRGLTVDENSELLELADEVERRGVERLEALSKLAELRGVSLRGLMQSLGVAAGDHG
jgi:hypothetical protein